MFLSGTNLEKISTAKLIQVRILSCAIWKTIFTPGLPKKRGCVYKKTILNFIYSRKKTVCK